MRVEFANSRNPTDKSTKVCQVTKVPRKMQVAYVGPFNPDNGRNRSIIRGLRSAGLAVDLVNNDSPHRLVRYAHCAHHAMANGSDVLIYGARGNRFGQPLSLAFSRVKRRVLVFDAVLTLYETFVIDRGYHGIGSLTAKVMHSLDRNAFAKSHIVLSDTNEHARYYSEEFGIPRSKFEVLHIGTDDTVFYPRPRLPHAGCTVGFWGGYIPLQGVDTIVEAARMLRSYPGITFKMNGWGQTYPKVKASANGLANMWFVRDWTPYEQLPSVVDGMDICLGIFGTGSKAQNVIPNKVYEALAMGKPIITADTPAARELLTDRINCLLVPPGDGGALASAILSLKEDLELRDAIARNGYDLFTRFLTPKATGLKLRTILTEYMENGGKAG